MLVVLEAGEEEPALEVLVPPKERLHHHDTEPVGSDSFGKDHHRLAGRLAPRHCRRERLRGCGASMAQASHHGTAETRWSDLIREITRCC